jgi:hypothetical protein
MSRLENMPSRREAVRMSVGPLHRYTSQTVAYALRRSGTRQSIDARCRNLCRDATFVCTRRQPLLQLKLRVRNTGPQSGRRRDCGPTPRSASYADPGHPYQDSELGLSHCCVVAGWGCGYPTTVGHSPGSSGPAGGSAAVGADIDRLRRMECRRNWTWGLPARRALS